MFFIPVAQRIEQRFSKPLVAGSNPAGNVSIFEQISVQYIIPELGGEFPLGTFRLGKFRIDRGNSIS